MSNSRVTLNITSATLCAALYAVGSYITSYIVSPWGVGQFRPAVVIPALFSVVFGPMPAGIGAAIGTLLADSANVGSFNVGSLIAAVPGNFLGFYVMGWILRKKFTWGRFILASNITLIFANLLVAVLYVGVYMNLFMAQLPNLPLEGLAIFVIGLTIWWFVTMLPFILIITPPLIRGVVKAFPSLVSEEVREKSLMGGIPEDGLAVNLLIPGVILLALGIAVSYTGAGQPLEAFFGLAIRNLISVIAYITSGVLCVLGLYIYLKNR
jgi:hypothetical protein